MRLKNIFLIIAGALSICSKILQFKSESIWGDIIILPSATLFVLAILLYIPKYEVLLYNDTTRKAAIIFAVLCYLTVLSFQLFTMITFGKGLRWGLIFIGPFLILGGFSILKGIWLLELK